MLEPNDVIDLINGYGKALYGLATGLALGAGFMILIVYASFLSWGASGFVYYSELALSLLSVVGLLVGLMFLWSSKKVFVRITMFSALTSAILGFWVLADTLNRDQGKTNIPQVTMGLIIPILFTSLGSLTAYSKLSQFKAHPR